MKQESQSVILCETLSFEDAWEGIIHNWLARVCSEIKDLPRAVIVPNDATIQFIKEQLLKYDIPLLNVYFFTPGTLRHFIAKRYNVQGDSELRENLQLLMKSVANDLQNNDVARSAAIEPEQFVRLADTIDSAGWGINALRNKSVRELIKKYQEAQSFYGIVTTQKIVDELYDLSKKYSKEIFSDVLIYGFSSRHWANYKLLITAARSVNKATICLLTQNSSRIIDQAWLGSWEEEFGFSKLILGPVQNKPFAYLSYSFEESSISQDRSEQSLPEIYIAEDILREAEVIVAKIAEILGEELRPTVGIVFPNQTSPLARAVGSLLEREQIAHYNHLGYLGGITRQRQLFELWVVWQKSMRLSCLCVFLERLTHEGILAYEEFSKFLKKSRSALQSVLTDNIEVVYAYLKFSSYDELLVDEWKLLPNEGTFQLYMQLAKDALKEIILSKDWELAEQRAGLFLKNFERIIKKEDFLSWLSSVTKTLGRTSNYWGEQQYAAVHMLTEEESLTQSWTHLILSGVNQGEWPSDKPEVLFLESKYLQELNYASLKEGRQGEGHYAVREGLSLFLSPIDHYEMSRCNFGVLIGRPSKQLIVTAHLKSPEEGKEILISEFLEKLYSIIGVTLLDKGTTKAILKNTNDWIYPWLLKFKQGTEKIFAEVKHAYHQRRDIQNGFNEYTFSFKEVNKEALNVSCKAWEDILLNPERAWFKHILKIEGRSFVFGKGLYALAKGIWVHEWINLEKKGIRMSIESWEAIIESQARDVYKVVEKIYKSMGEVLPDIWKAYWHETRRVTISLCKALGDNLCDGYLFPEFSLSDDSIDESFLLNIPLKGRVDLMIYALADLNIKDNSLKIFDFKTGASGALTKDKLRKGIGIQLVLYALKFYKEGFKQIEVSIIQPGVAFKKQLDLNDILENITIFDAINFIYESGKLGVRNLMGGNYENNFNFPLATIKVEDIVLEKKWMLTHSNLEFNS